MGKLVVRALWLVVVVNYWLRQRGLLADRWCWADVALLHRHWYVTLDYHLHRWDEA